MHRKCTGLCIATLWLMLSAVVSQAETPTVSPVGEVCSGEACKTRHAVFFIHGIYGDSETFKNGAFDWPNEIARKITDGQQITASQVDVYRIEYKTLLFAWAKKDVASFDEVEEKISDALFGRMPFNGSQGQDGILVSAGGAITRPYKSLNFIAHSLGGNIAASVIHSAKSRFGHERRARFGFVITLGTPANGAEIANVGSIIKDFVGASDPLLKSLQKDNTFLRMLLRWREAENAKATNFNCRPVHIYPAAEGRIYPALGVVIVPNNSAEAVKNIAFQGKIKLFENEDHSSIAKPNSKEDPVYKWVEEIIDNEIKRLNQWSPPLCHQVNPLTW